MNKELFEALLPKNGVICVAGITPKTTDAAGKKSGGTVTPRFAKGVDEVLDLVERFKAMGNQNVYFTPCSFAGLKRDAVGAVSAKSFYLDLEFEHGSDKYDNAEQLLEAFGAFCEDVGLPFPVLISSGGGFHAYWIFNEEVPVEEWKPYAEKLKELCISKGLKIDQPVTTDAARLLRVPNTLNLRYDPPREAKLLTSIDSHDFEFFVNLLGKVEKKFSLSDIERGVDDESKALYEKINSNYEYSFEKIVQLSIEGDGCGQIRKIVTEAASCPEPLWYAGLSVAVRCTDGAESIHLMSEDYPGYSREETERKAEQSLREAKWSHSCTAFATANAGGCDGCKHRGKLGKSGPIALGRVIKIEAHVDASGDEQSGDTKAGNQVPSKEDTAWTDKDQVVFPDFLKPYIRPAGGGVVYMTPGSFDSKSNKMIPGEPVLITPNDVYPIKRMYSPHDGECLVMRLRLPKDGDREFLLPMKDVVAVDKLKTLLASNGVVFEPTHAPRLSSYLVKWATYLTNTRRADVMRLQMGWTEDCESFVIGTTEIRNGERRYCPPSPTVKNVAKHLHPQGDYQVWKDCVAKLDAPGFEVHAFTVLMGFATALVEFTSVNGGVLSLWGKSGTAKTGAMYAAMSVWGSPEPLCLNDGTANAMIQRLVGLKNLPFCLDEQGNSDGKTISDVIHKTSAGRPKLRMQSSVNQERDAEYTTSTWGIVTTNHSLVQLMETYKHDVAAEELRLLELQMTNDRIDAALGKAIFDPLKYNYGYAGPEFVEALAKMGTDAIRRRVDEAYRESSQHIAKGAGEYRFIANKRATALVAGEITNELGITNFNLTRIFKMLDIHIAKFVSQRTVKDQGSTDDILGDFINKNVRSILVIRDGRVTVSPTNSLYIRAEVDTGTIWVSSSAMKEYLATRRIGAREFEAKLEAAGIYFGRHKKQMAAGWQEAIGPVNVWAYKIEYNIDDLIEDVKPKTDE